jgi:HlyD family secretion protein
MGRRHWVLLATLVISSVVATIAILGSRKPSLQVQVAPATTGAVAREVLTSGTLEPASVVDAGTQVSGTIQSLHADFNSKLKAGDVIAELDPSVYDSELAQARSEVIEADASVQEMRIFADDARTKAERARALSAKGLITLAEHDAALLAEKDIAAKLTAARAAAGAARAALRQAKITRSRTVIRSPIDGVVVSRNVEVGQTLAASVQSPVLFRIADLRRMHLLAEVGEAEVGGVQRGTPVTFEIEALGSKRFTGTVTEVRLQPIQTAASSTISAAATSGSQSSSSSRSPASGPAPGAATPAASIGTTPAQPAAPGSTAAAGAAPAGPGSTAAAGAAPAGGVVSYTAIVEVDNSDNRIPPGSTAVVLLPTARRAAVLRVPNRALAFRPAPDVLRATGQTEMQLPRPDAENDPTKGRQAIVWKYERGMFVPIDVRIGIADERWTEILAGSIQPGDQVVTDAVRAR